MYLIQAFHFTGQYYTNPLVDSNHPDPGVLKLLDNSGYVAVSTGVYSDGIFPILYSKDMVHWIDVIQKSNYQQLLILLRILFFSKNYIFSIILYSLLTKGLNGPIEIFGPQKFIL